MDPDNCIMGSLLPWASAFGSPARFNLHRAAPPPLWGCSLRTTDLRHAVPPASGGRTWTTGLVPRIPLGTSCAHTSHDCCNNPPSTRQQLTSYLRAAPPRTPPHTATSQSHPPCVRRPPPSFEHPLLFPRTTLGTYSPSDSQVTPASSTCVTMPGQISF